MSTAMGVPTTWPCLARTAALGCGSTAEGPDNRSNTAKVAWSPHGTIAMGVGEMRRPAYCGSERRRQGRVHRCQVCHFCVSAWLNGC
ncbi:uncharacterized protein B0I36DRAFT_319613 [Microdochium trichocladiopsis]|uniref:Uncharacterized protein n=1 Tax=Microdochium trichocladiopsis TaxID=1682393 RepID=A0A9P9BRC1_9PEZI|nr:uncharacterized protein B0I36DRAFT_319613 [Microdochium trichocladiopsis]KAH7032563.1 hypothetical protein B0I36DRAFT_319613 [Microdochium trichocladiopsis]